MKNFKIAPELAVLGYFVIIIVLVLLLKAILY